MDMPFINMIKCLSFYILVYINLITYFVENCQTIEKIIEFALKGSLYWLVVTCMKPDCVFTL